MNFNYGESQLSKQPDIPDCDWSGQVAAAFGEFDHNQDEHGGVRAHAGRAMAGQAWRTNDSNA